jgi:hypothetical protein
VTTPTPSAPGPIIMIPKEPFVSRFPTIRDHFAMAALIGNMANPNIRFQSFYEMATESYQMADAMMKARGQ